jgi:hypothetical protein
MASTLGLGYDKNSHPAAVPARKADADRKSARRPGPDGTTGTSERESEQVVVLHREREAVTGLLVLTVQGRDLAVAEEHAGADRLAVR